MMNFLAEFYRGLGDELGVETAVTHPLPHGTTAQIRTTKTEKFIFLQNFNATEVHIQLDESDTTDMVSGQKVDRKIILPAYSLQILRQPTN